MESEIKKNATTEFEHHQKLTQFNQFLVSKSRLPSVSVLNAVSECVESIQQTNTSIRGGINIDHDDVEIWIYFVENYYLGDWDIVNQIVPCKPCNKQNDLKIQDFANYLAMRYELHKQGVVDWFNNLEYKFGNDINDNISILRLKDNDSYQQLSSFLGCKTRREKTMRKSNSAKRIRYRIIPKYDTLDWRSYFKGNIPILTVDKQNRRSKFEMIDDGPLGYRHLW